MRALSLILVLIGFMFGCTKTFDVPTHHVVMFDSDGTAVDPRGNDGIGQHSHFRSYTTLSDEEYRDYLTALMNEIDNSTNNPKKIMIFIHGGLNTQVGSLERLIEPFDKEDKMSRVELMKEAGYYPIFVNWKSSLWSSYFEHLLRIRQGKRWSRWTGWPSALVVFPVDVTRSVVRAPLVWGMQIWNDFETAADVRNHFAPSLSDEVSKELLCRYNLQGPLKDCIGNNDDYRPVGLQFQKPPYCLPFTREARPPAYRPPTVAPNTNTFPIEVGEDYRRCSEMNTYFASYFLTLPVKLAVAPVLDTFGTSAWQNMERRIQLLFHKEQEYIRPSPIIDAQKDKHEFAFIEASGGLSVFVEQLKTHMNGKKWELVLVGHSMGTIVINELLRQYGDELPVSHVVYLAAAASIRDYEDSVFPFLKKHPDAQFYNLTLHPISDKREVQWDFLDLTPRGSLLDWLDSFLADPQTLVDRTVGRYDNFIQTMHDTPLDPKLRHRIHFRSFGAGAHAEKDNPQTHHDASDRFRFWLPDCWEVNANLERCVRPLK